MSKFTIKDRVEYVSYNTQHEVTLPVNKYLLRDFAIQNSQTSKTSVLEK